MKKSAGKILLITLLLAGAAAAGLGIAQIWLAPLAWEDFIRALVTVLIAGALAGFLVAVDYDAEASRTKIILGALVILSVTLAGLAVAQLWWAVLEWSVFVKIFGTVLILLLLVSFAGAVREDFGTARKLRDDHYLD